MSVHTVRITRALGRINWPVLFLVLFLCLVGLLMQYSAGGGHFKPYAYSQTLRFIPGFILMLVVAFIPLQVIVRYSYLIYAGCLTLLVAVEIAGHIGMGAQRWIALGPVNLQPSELMKIAVILALARYFNDVHPNERPSPLVLMVPLLLLLMPAALILKQPNLGTASILMMVGGMVFLVAGVRWIYFMIIGGGALAALPIAWQFLHDYQKKRVLTFLDPEKDPLGAGYNIIQSVIAIGSGGLFGKGFLKGSQGQLDFLPEKQTDFIFTMLSEEFGFIGSGFILLCYTLLILYALGIGIASRNRFGSLVAVGISAMLFLHVFINVGMSMGMLPVVGVPLPLLSYGGTMLLSMLLAFGLLLNVWANHEMQLKPRKSL